MNLACFVCTLTLYTHKKILISFGHIVHIPPSKSHIQHSQKINKAIFIVLVHNHSLLSYKTACLYFKGTHFPMHAAHINSFFDTLSTLIQYMHTTQKNKTWSFLWRLFVHIHSSYAYQGGILKGISGLGVHTHTVHADHTTQKNKTWSFLWRLFVHIHSSHAY